jgi:zinc transport system permease protein
MEQFLTFISYPFIQRAIVVGCIIGITAAVLGVFVTLRNMSFYADAISHSALAGIALGLLLNISPFLSAVVFCIILGIGTVFIKHRSQASIDTVIGILFAGGLSLGVVLLSLLQGYRNDLFSFLFGDILAITWDDIALAAGLGAVILTFLLFTSKRLLLSTFSTDFSYVRGIDVRRLEYAFFIITSLTIALSIKMIGIILITGLLIIPAAIAKNIAQSFKQTVIYSMIASIVSTLIGITISYYLNIPSGPAIILVGIMLFIFSALFRGR